MFWLYSNFYFWTKKLKIIILNNKTWSLLDFVVFLKTVYYKFWLLQFCCDALTFILFFATYSKLATQRIILCIHEALFHDHIKQTHREHFSIYRTHEVYLAISIYLLLCPHWDQQNSWIISKTSLQQCRGRHQPDFVKQTDKL